MQLVPLHTCSCPERPYTWRSHSLKLCTLSSNFCFVSEVRRVEQVRSMSTSAVLRHPSPAPPPTPLSVPCSPTVSDFPDAHPRRGIRELPKQVQGEGATPTPEWQLGRQRPPRGPAPFQNQLRVPNEGQVQRDTGTSKEPSRARACRLPGGQPFPRPVIPPLPHAPGGRECW